MLDVQFDRNTLVCGEPYVAGPALLFVVLALVSNSDAVSGRSWVAWCGDPGSRLLGHLHWNIALVGKNVRNTCRSLAKQCCATVGSSLT